MIELLAPAKDKNCAIAAIDFGADAIYIGASSFGARKNAPNSFEDIEEIVRYAHKFNVKVYVTINTILIDDEILTAKKLVEDLYKIGVDAIIVQDMGLVTSLRDIELCVKTGDSHQSNLPQVMPLSLHASTQCDNRTVEKVKFLESVGFTRVILARELSIDQIKEIKKETNVELETFIHGALCVSYSGQCYLSSLIGGRSANRGECAQPCRKKYSLVDEDGNFIAKDQYLLNLKDFNASNHLKSLAEAGVTSFKIEGRLKDENYVKNVVGYYRKLIDELAEENPILRKTSSGDIILDFEPKLEKSFNRGFTDYFLEKRGECYSFLSPKSMGEFIGKVIKISGNYFEVKFADTALETAAQDGLCFHVKGELSGCLVNRVEEVKEIEIPFNAVDQTPNRTQRIYPNKIDGIAVGTEIYRNVDSEFEKILKNSKTSRKISADITFDKKNIKIVDQDNNSVEISYKFEEFAQNEEKMVENIQTQLKKSGESDFLINNVQINTDKIPFLPISKINELRRELLEKLTLERLKNYKQKSRPEMASESQNYPQKEIDYSANVLNQCAKKFYQDHGCEVTEMALESEGLGGGFWGNVKHGKKAMTTKHCLKYSFGMCNSNKELHLIDEKGKKYPLKFNCDKCEMEIYY